MAREGAYKIGRWQRKSFREMHKCSCQQAARMWPDGGMAVSFRRRITIGLYLARLSWPHTEMVQTGTVHAGGRDYVSIVKAWRVGKNCVAEMKDGVWSDSWRGL